MPRHSLYRQPEIPICIFPVTASKCWVFPCFSLRGGAERWRGSSDRSCPTRQVQDRRASLHRSFCLLPWPWHKSVRSALDGSLLRHGFACSELEKPSEK